MKQDSDFFANDEKDTHCVQACYQMVVARTSGVQISVQDAESETGFEPDMLSWQFALLLSLADRHNLYVRDHEDFHPERFVADPIQEIRDQIGDEDAVKHQIAHTNIAAEVERARMCLDHSRIEFRSGAPTFDDLLRVVSAGAQVICLINGAVLLDREGYRPHSIVIRSITDDIVELDDPGPPPGPAWKVPKDKFLKAWMDPSPSVTNYIAASTTPLP